MSAIKVAVIGATGKTGRSVVNGLLASSTKFEITALTRESSLHNEANDSLRNLGLKVAAFDILGPREHLLAVFTGLDVVVSCVHFSQIPDQINMIDAMKEAGIKRFVPSDFATPAPLGVTAIHDRKAEVLAAVQRAYLPYTVIDDGWWYQNISPPLPSGRTDHAVWPGFSDIFVGDGTVPVALMHNADIGLYVAGIIADPRTINKKVFAYTEVLTLNEIFGVMGEVSGEEPVKKIVSAKEIKDNIELAKKGLEKDPDDFSSFMSLALHQYASSWGVRGDNSPEAAKYLGYLDCKDLYPDIKGAKLLRAYFQGLIAEKPTSK